MAKTVGQHVRYVPAECYAKSRNARGAYPWSFGWLDERTQTVSDPLTDEEVFEKIKFMYQRGPKRTTVPGKNKASCLVPLGPKVTWDAVIAAVHADGTCDLDIDYCLGGVTNHHSNVVEDPTGKTPDTFHTEGA